MTTDRLVLYVTSIAAAAALLPGNLLVSICIRLKDQLLRSRSISTAATTAAAAFCNPGFRP